MSKSSEIVLNWINNEIKLRPKIVDIKKSFSNGYHFAEIFYILKLITPEEFSKFVNTENISDKKSNFAKIERICQKLFNLIIPDGDINLIMNKDYSKAVVLLYKIRNCIYKNNIHFNDIQIFGNAFSGDEIDNQIKEIIKRQFLNDNDEENNESEEKSLNINSMNNNENIVDDKKSEKFEEEKNIFNKNNFNADNDIKEAIIEENEDIDNKFKNKFSNTLNKRSIKIKKNLPSIKLIKTSSISKDNEFDEIKNKLLVKPKKILAPINQKLLKNKSNSCENIFIKPIKNNEKNIIKFRNTNQSDFFNGIISRNNFNTKLINISHFNKKLDDLGVTSNDYKLDEETNSIENGNTTIFNIYNNPNVKNNDNKTDILYVSMYKTKTVDEVRSELRKKINYKKIENVIKQKEIKRELSQKKIDDNKTEINFLNINKNKFLEKNKSMSLLFKNFSNKSLLRRIDYSKELAKKIEKENNEKKYFDKSNYYLSQKEFLPMLLSKDQFQLSRNNQKRNEHIFNSKKFFEKLNKLNYITNKLKSEQKQKIKYKNSILIKEIVLFIIDMAMEGYFYQKKNNMELMDLKTFLKFNIYFLKNKPLRKKLIIKEDNEYKRSSKFEEKIDIENLISSLTNEEKYLIQDYIYYLGIWNDESIYDKKLRGLKLEYKYINSNSNNNINMFNSNYFGFNEYEPTVLENEDLTLPKYNTDDYLLGNTIIDVLEHNFNDNKNLNNNELKLEIKNNNKNLNKNNEKNINNLHNGSKWEYIPYKIALIGYPLSGRKTVSEKINNKYPNIKIYSMNQIIKDYYELYLKYSDLPDKSIKNKNQKKKGKKNEKEKEKEKNKS